MAPYDQLPAPRSIPEGALEATRRELESVVRHTRSRPWPSGLMVTRNGIGPAAEATDLVPDSWKRATVRRRGVFMALAVLVAASVGVGLVLVGIRSTPSTRPSPFSAVATPTSSSTTACPPESVVEGTTTRTVPCPSVSVTLPDVVGMSTPTAAGELSGLGVFVEVVNVASSTVPNGHVVATSPGAGSSVAARSTVTIGNSLG
jgi:hypothetical protein